MMKWSLVSENYRFSLMFIPVQFHELRTFFFLASRCHRSRFKACFLCDFLFNFLFVGLFLQAAGSFLVNFRFGKRLRVSKWEGRKVRRRLKKLLNDPFKVCEGVGRLRGRIFEQKLE